MDSNTREGDALRLGYPSRGKFKDGSTSAPKSRLLQSNTDLRGQRHWRRAMYGRQPLNDLQLLTCPKCGAPQESPGSTVCELCGANLPHPRVKKPRSSHPALRLKHVLRGPVRLLTRGIAAMQLLVFLVLRGVTLLLLFTSLVIGSSFVPEVNALLPATKEIAAPARQWLQRAEDWAGKLLASWEAEPQPQRPASQSAASPQKLAPAHFEATQAVMISSVPGGATVRVNAREMGKTPMTLKLTPGTYKVTISRPGYATVSRTITVRRGKAASLGVSLARKGPAPAQPIPPWKQPRDAKQHDQKQDDDP